MQIELDTATVAELKAARKTLATAYNVALCREQGHPRDSLRVQLVTLDGIPVFAEDGTPTGVECTQCGATWPIENAASLTAPAPRNPYPG